MSPRRRGDTQEPMNDYLDTNKQNGPDAPTAKQSTRTATPATTKQQEHNMSTTDSTALTATAPTGFHELEDWFDPANHTGLWVRPEKNLTTHGVELYLTWTPDRGAYVEDRDGEALDIAELDALTTRLHALRDALLVAQAEHRARTTGGAR